MRRCYLAALTIIGTVYVSAFAPASAEVITYKFEGVVLDDTYFGSAGSDVVGYFSHKDNLPEYLATPGFVSYGYSSYTQPSDIYFQIYYEDHPVFSTDTHTRLHIYNDYHFDNPNVPLFDAFIISGNHVYSPGITIPPGVQVEFFLRDSDYSVFDSTDIPTELPAITEFEYRWVLPTNAMNTEVTSITRINNGDLNGGGFVGIEDLNVVLNNWNQDVTLGDRLSGDSSNDGSVGIEDLNAVLGNWNAGTPPTSNDIPEPATLVLFSLGIVLTQRRR